MRRYVISSLRINASLFNRFRIKRQQACTYASNYICDFFFTMYIYNTHLLFTNTEGCRAITQGILNNSGMTFAKPHCSLTIKSTSCNARNLNLGVAPVASAAFTLIITPHTPDNIDAAMNG